ACAAADPAAAGAAELEEFCQRALAHECEEPPAEEEESPRDQPGEGEGEEGNPEREACLEEVIEACLSEYGHECEGEGEGCREELAGFCEREFAHECD
ncbi:MAG: hypothetical protein OXT09_06015, partial [Myxococcales bacterium]|nr:hypothetical protein [Myxococcales bacterium]